MSRAAPFIAKLVEPHPAFCFAQAADHADQGLPYGPDGDKAQDAALEALAAVRANSISGK